MPDANLRMFVALAQVPSPETHANLKVIVILHRFCLLPDYLGGASCQAVHEEAVASGGALRPPHLVVRLCLCRRDE